MRLGRRGVGDWVFDMQLRLDDRRLIICEENEFVPLVSNYNRYSSFNPNPSYQ